MIIHPIIETDPLELIFIVPENAFNAVKSKNAIASIVDLDEMSDNYRHFYREYIEFLCYGFKDFRNYCHYLVKVVLTDKEDVFLLKIDNSLLSKNLALKVEPYTF